MKATDVELMKALWDRVQSDAAEIKELKKRVLELSAEVAALRLASGAAVQAATHVDPIQWAWDRQIVEIEWS